MSYQMQKKIRRLPPAFRPQVVVYEEINDFNEECEIININGFEINIQPDESERFRNAKWKGCSGHEFFSSFNHSSKNETDINFSKESDLTCSIETRKRPTYSEIDCHTDRINFKDISENPIRFLDGWLEDVCIERNCDDRMDENQSNFMVIESEDEEGNICSRSVPMSSVSNKNLLVKQDIPLIFPGYGPIDRSWIEDVMWDPKQEVQSPSLILSETDSKMFFNKQKTEKPLLTLKTFNDSQGPQELNTIMIDNQHKLLMAEEKSRRLKSAAKATGFNYSVDTLIKGISTDRTMRAVEIPPPIHPSLVNEKVLLKVPQPDDIREYHRSIITRLLFPGKKIALKALNNKSASSQMETATLRGGQTISAIRRETDLIPLKPHSNFILVEYIEERPPILCSTGMASRFINWWRSSKNGSNKEDRKLDRLGRRMPFGGEGIEKPPQCVDGLSQRLDPQEESPFMGEIKPGMVQPSLCNELYRTPLFMHQSASTDFLLIQEPARIQIDGTSSNQRIHFDINNKSQAFIGREKRGFVMVIKEIPRLYLAGQLEPQREVFVPNSKEAHIFQTTYLSFQVAQLFSSSIAKQGISPGELRAHFRATGVSSEELHKVADHFAGMKTIGSKDTYFRRSFELELTSEKEKFRLEDVCLWESMLQAHRYLKDIGIRSVTSSEEISEELVKLKSRQDKLSGMISEAEEVKKFAEKDVILAQADVTGKLSSAREKFRVEALSSLLNDLYMQLRDIQHVRAVAQYIFEELQLTPWMLTSSFVKTHIKKEGSGMMKLAGVGDPSGIGEGFSFLQKPTESSGQSDANIPSNFDLDQLSLKKVTGTNADLRKLNMRELEKQLIDLGMEKEAVARLQRWDRVQMISHMANLAVTHNTQDAASVSRFTRKPRKSTASEKKQYKSSIQEIWDRQASALSLGHEEVTGYSFIDKQRVKPQDPLLSKATSNKKESSSTIEDEDPDDQFEELFVGVPSDTSARNAQQRMADLIRQPPTSSGDVAQREEEKELNALKKNLASEKTGRNAHGSDINTVDSTKKSTQATEYDNYMAELASKLRPLCPKRVIKRIERKINEDGGETLIISFDFNQERLRKLEAHNLKKDLKGSKKPPLAHFIPKLDLSQNIVDYDSFDDEGAQRAHKIKLSVMRKRIQEYMDGKKRKAEEDRNAMREIYKVPRFNSSHRRGARSLQPHNIFIEKLLSIIDVLIGRPDSGPFLRPISKTADSKADWYPLYRAKIKHPMDLNTLKYNTQHFKYRNKEQFVAELKFIASNAVEFNGSDHPLAQAAMNIVEDGRLQVEANGTELDELAKKYELSGIHSTRIKGSGTEKDLVKKKKRRKDPDKLKKSSFDIRDNSSLNASKHLSSSFPKALPNLEKPVSQSPAVSPLKESKLEDNRNDDANQSTSSGSSGDEDVEGGVLAG